MIYAGGCRIMREDRKRAEARGGERVSSVPISSRLTARRLLTRGRVIVVRIEAALWDALDQIAEERGVEGDDLASSIIVDAPAGTRADSAVRLFVLRHYRAARTI